MKVPSRACVFVLDDVDSLHLAAASDGKEQQKPTFEMVANSGRPILGHWYWGNLGIDLAGVKCKKRMAVLKDHDPDQRIGFSTTVERGDAGLVVRGELLSSSALAQQIRQESQEGFPWQASVHLRPLKIERLELNQTAEVNGHVIVGPGHIFRKSECREVSFTALGADSETSASAMAGTSPTEHEVELLDTNMSATKTDPAAQPPAVLSIDAARAEASSAALSAERNRVTAILAAGGDQVALAQKLINDGVQLTDALRQINDALRASVTDLQGKLAAKPHSDKPLSSGNSGADTPAKSPLDAAREMSEGREKWAKLFELDQAIHAEFSSAEQYCAFMSSPGARGSQA